MKPFSVLILLLLLSGLTMPAMAADPIKAGEEMISGGIKAFFVDAADSVFAWGVNSNETMEVKDKFGYAAGSVFRIAADEHDPYESNTVQEMRKRTAVVGVFIFILYIFYGAACVNLSCGGMGFIGRAQYIISETPFGEYKNTLLKAFAAIFFTHYIFKFIIMFNAAVTTQVMYSVADSIQLTSDHWLMYCMMALCYGAELVFFAMRILLMDLIAGSDILIGALFAFSFTREFSIETIKYFGKITLLQFIVVLLTAFGIAIIDASPYWQPLKYLCLMIVLFCISGGIMFGFTRLFSAGKLLVKKGVKI